MMSDSLETPFAAEDRFRTLELAATGSFDGGVPARYSWRVWYASPTHWRDDLSWPNGETTAIIVRPDATLAWVSMHRALYTSEPLAGAVRPQAGTPDDMRLPTIAERLEEFPLLRPRLPPSVWDHSTLGHELWLGRPVRRVLATRRAGRAPAEEPIGSGYWPAMEEYDYLIDDALGILLRLVGKSKGIPVTTIAIDSVHVDAPLPAGIFELTPPSGTRIVHVTRSA